MLSDPIIFKIKNHTFYVFDFLNLIYRIDISEITDIQERIPAFSFAEIESGKLEFAPNSVLYDKDYFELQNYLGLYREALDKYKKLSIFI